MKSESAAFWSLVRQFEWWELALMLAIFASLTFGALQRVSTLDDEGVYSEEDVIVSWYCTSGIKSEYQNMVGQSGRVYTMGGSSSACSKGAEYYIGRRLTAYFVPGKDSPIQVDFEGGGGYKAGIQKNIVALYVILFGFPMFMFFFIVAKKRRGDYKDQNKPRFPVG